MTLICVLYARMLVRLLRGSSAAAGGGGPQGRRSVTRGLSVESVRARRRVTRLVVVVVAVFGACWLPIHVVFIVQYFDSAAFSDESAITNTFVAVRLAANCLAYANSCLNPILYAFLSDNFRSGLAYLCRRDGGQHRSWVVEARRQRAVATKQRDIRGAGDDQVVRPLMMAEGRDCSAGDFVRVEAGVSAAQQVPACQTEIIATVETIM